VQCRAINLSKNVWSELGHNRAMLVSLCGQPSIADVAKLEKQQTNCIHRASEPTNKLCPLATFPLEPPGARLLASFAAYLFSVPVLPVLIVALHGQSSLMSST
jgi:hypothetical protein